MALLEKRRVSAIQTTSTPAQSGSAEKTVTLAPALATSATSGSTDDQPMLPQAEKTLVEFLRNESSVAAVTRVHPELATDAINAAVAYVTDRSSDQWLHLILCDPQTVLDSVRKLAAVGLCVSSDAGTAFLVPRKDKSGRAICTPVPGVKGFERIILEACPEATIEANVIRDQDSIEVSEGTNPQLSFRRNFRPDRAKPNPIVGSYCVVREKPGTPTRYQIKTIAIEEKKEIANPGKANEREVSVFMTHDGRKIEPGRMGAESACRYVAQRACMREVARTWLMGNKRIEALLNMEDASLRSGEEIEGSGRRLARRSDERAPSKLEISATKASAKEQPEEIPVTSPATSEATAGVSV